MGERRNGPEDTPQPGTPEYEAAMALIKSAGEAIGRRRRREGDEEDQQVADEVRYAEPVFRPDPEKMEGKHSDDL